LALSAANFRGVLEDLLGGLLRHGLTKIIILNGHGGNAPVIHEVTLRLRETQGLIIPSLYRWKVARAMLERSAPALSAGAFGHGGEPLFSVTGTLRPALVGEAAPPPGPAAKMLALPVSGFGTVAFQGLPIDVPATFEATAQGAAPAALAHAEPARGPALVAALVKFGVAFVAHVDRVARASAVSKSRSTESEATGSSKTNSM
jgi:creatinine amidohydrolase